MDIGELSRAYADYNRKLSSRKPPMRHTALPVLLSLLAASPGAHGAPEATQVYLDNGELHYVGALDEEANKRLFVLYDGLADKPTVLSIRSKGGEIDVGMGLGHWVHERRLDIKVLEYCMSSCANYVFPAARRKTVSNFAVIGYHGGPSSGKVGISASFQKIIDAMPPEERKTFMEDIDKSIKADGDKELAYLRSLGVREDLSTLGQQPRYQQLFEPHPDILGWTYSLEGFARLGVHGITVINPPWKPGSAMRKVSFVLIEPEPTPDQTP